MKRIVILSYGMGVESTAILLRWINEPETCPCALEDLIVITAMTGAEYPDTGRDVEAHILPLMRKHGIRYVQLARHGQFQAQGITVLSDTDIPKKLYLDGDYRLTDQLIQMGTVPQYAGERRCSLNFKGWVIETWLEANVREPARHAFGYNCDEPTRVKRCEAAFAKRFQERIAFGYNRDEGKRVKRAAKYNTATRTGFYPLVEWNWSRQASIDYIYSKLGVVWRKSACVLCPFNENRDDCFERQVEYSAEVATAMAIEHTAMAMNPRAALYPDGQSLIQIQTDRGNRAAVEAFENRLAAEPWALYRVRRLYSKPGKAERAVERLDIMPREAALAGLQSMAARFAAPVELQRGHPYLYREKRVEGVYPAREEYYTAALAVVPTKAAHGIPRFDSSWNHRQESLFDMAPVIAPVIASAKPSDNIRPICDRSAASRRAWETIRKRKAERAA